MRIAMLGPLEVRAGDGALVEVAGARLRTLLILLALSDGAVAGTDRLIDGVWGDRPPAGAANASGVDRRCWTRAGQDFAATTVARLEELRLTAVEARVDADLLLGRGAELVTELTALVAAHPLRERLVGALMRALCAAGRPAEALTVFDRARTVLAEELGTDPSPGLSAIHATVLRGDQARTNLRAGLTSFVGRDRDLAAVRDLAGEYRLTTLTGPGGAGKTRLSVEAARSPRVTWPVPASSTRRPSTGR